MPSADSEKRSGKDREYYLKNREKIIEKKQKISRGKSRKNRERRREYYLKNREKISENDRKYREVNREKIEDYRKAYREANREAIREKDKKYCEANREKIKEYHRERYRKNSELYKEDSARRRKLNSPENPRNGRWTEEEIAILIDNQGMTNMQFAFLLQRSYQSVSYQINRLRKAGIIV